MTHPDDRALAHDYLHAVYRVHGPVGEMELCVGAVASAVEQTYPARRYGFLTAWNPASVDRDAAENENADARLVAELSRTALRGVPAEASSATGAWLERGWLLLDVDPRVLKTLGREYGQAGVLFWSRGEPVRLQMLRARPDGMADVPWTDWLE